MNSSEWFRLAVSRIPGGVNSPVRAFKHVGMEPLYFSRASGPYLYDVDQKPYVDFCLSFGPHILGHSNPTVVKALQAQAEMGTSFGACHPKEVELAGWILKGYPFLDKVRLVNSGTEAVMTAVRIARGFTGRDKIVAFDGCYHGHSDGFLARAGSGVAELAEASSKGVPQSIVSDTIIASLDDLDSLEKVFQSQGDKIAAVLLEMIPANNGLTIPKRETIVRVFELAKKYGALVIGDEVITGFRLGLSGASGYYDVRPDIVTLGKIIGGGLPLAAIVGRSEVMDMLAPVGSVYQAGTLSGNPLATAAGCVVLETLFNNPPYKELEKQTVAFAEKLGEVLGVKVRTIASMFWFQLEGDSTSFPPAISRESSLAYANLFRKALEQGIYLPPSPYEVSFLSTAHTASILGDVIKGLGNAHPRK